MLIRSPTAEEDDAVAELLYETSTGMYDLFTGGRERALRVLREAYASEGNSASRDVVKVAELDGRIAGAMAAFPVPEGHRRARAFLRLTLRRIPPWRWPRTLRVFRLGGRLTPPAPSTALYVDALATDPRMRRRGVATALLRAAEDDARERGLTAVALDTAERNTAAQALYERFGMERSGTTQSVRGIPGAVAYIKRV